MNFNDRGVRLTGNLVGKPQAPRGRWPLCLCRPVHSHRPTLLPEAGPLRRLLDALPPWLWAGCPGSDLKEPPWNSVPLPDGAPTMSWAQKELGRASLCQPAAQHTVLLWECQPWARGPAPRCSFSMHLTLSYLNLAIALGRVQMGAIAKHHCWDTGHGWRRPRFTEKTHLGQVKHAEPD